MIKIDKRKVKIKGDSEEILCNLIEILQGIKKSNERYYNAIKTICLDKFFWTEIEKYDKSDLKKPH